MAARVGGVHRDGWGWMDEGSMWTFTWAIMLSLLRPVVGPVAVVTLPVAGRCHAHLDGDMPGVGCES